MTIRALPFVLFAACRGPEAGGPDPVRSSPPPGPEIAFDLSAGAAFFDAPFPSAHRVREGRVVTDGWPNPDQVPYVDVLVDLGAEATGFGTTSGVLFRRREADVALVPVDARASMEADAPAFLVAVSGDRAGARVPVDVWADPDGGPFGAPGMVTMLPLQGVPLEPETTYAAVLMRSLGADGPFGIAEPLWAAIHGEVPEGWSDETARAYLDALRALEAQGVPIEEIAGLAVYRTWDPTAELRAVAAAARSLPPPLPEGTLTVTEVHDAFCVLEGEVQMPVYQRGDPPYDEDGGWVIGPDGAPERQGTATSRLWVTVPRTPAPEAGYPAAVMIRTGGGGDRPLVDRGVRATAGGEAIAPGTGPALELARAGIVGVQVDGPHGGPHRNPTGGDEQFLMFNVTNPLATRDNVRQSAVEIALLPATLAALSLDAGGCPDATAAVPLDLDGIGLIGHSMGATIAPLALAAAPEFDAVVLSGAGGSYLYNLVYKRSPIDVRPLAEALLGFSTRGRTLREDDAVLQLLQWVSEPADPPVYARRGRRQHPTWCRASSTPTSCPPWPTRRACRSASTSSGPPSTRTTPISRRCGRWQI